MRRGGLGQIAVQGRRRHSPIPDCVSFADGLHQPVQASTGFCRDQRDLDSLKLWQQPIDIAPQSRQCARLRFDQVPFVDRNNNGAPFPLDKVGNPDVLLLERGLRVNDHDDDFGETDRIERVGHRELFQLLLDARTAAQPGGVMYAEVAAPPIQIDGNRIAGNAGFGAG